MLEAAADFQVGCILYTTSKVGIIKAIFLHSLSHELNWIGYVATTSDQAAEALGRHDIYALAGHHQELWMDWCLWRQAGIHQVTIASQELGSMESD